MRPSPQPDPSPAPPVRSFSARQSPHRHTAASHLRPLSSHPPRPLQCVPLPHPPFTYRTHPAPSAPPPSAPTPFRTHPPTPCRPASSQVRPVDLVSRVTEAVAAIPRARYTPEERAMVETGGVSVWGIIPRGGGGYDGYGGAPMHPFLAGRRLEPLRCLPPSPIGTHGKGLGKGQGKGGGSGVGVLHFSPGAHGAPLGRWSWPDETGGHAAAGGATPRALPAHAVPAGFRPAAATPAPPLSGAAAVSGYSPQGPNLLGVLLPNLASCSAVPGAKLRSPPLPDAAAYGATHVPAQPPRLLQHQSPWRMGGARPDLVRPPPPLHPVAFSSVPPPGLPAGHPAPPPPGSLPPPSAFMVGRGRGGSGAGGSTRA